MEAAGVREKENAIEKNNIYEDGTPWITVYLDGSWSKRTYGHNYDALSGMVSILLIYYVLMIIPKKRFLYSRLA